MLKLRKCSLLLMGLCLALLMGELLFRLLPDRVLGFGYRDDCFVTPKEFERDPFRNNLGFHDSNHGPKRRKIKRVLLLGDSYVEALSVRVPKIVGKRLQHHLNRNSPARYEVVSLGKEDRGQRQELLELQRLGPKLKPDLVITLILTLNDIRNNSPPLEAQALKDFWSADRPRPNWTRIPKDQAPLLVFEWSHLNRVFSFHMGRMLSGKREVPIPLDYFVYAKEYDKEWEQAWEQTKDLLLRMRDQSKSLGAPFVLVSASTPQGVLGAKQGLELLKDTYPRMKKKTWDLDKPDRMLKEFCEENKIPFLALEPIFRSSKKSKKGLHWKYDGHWNAAGNDFAGEKIAEFVLTLK